MNANERMDIELKTRLISYSKGSDDYWSFRGKDSREHAHAYLQYPAMMVPRMQGELINMVREICPDLKTVYDPFVGSGTIMTEVMLQGLDFTGQDINPLAVLICQAKKGPFYKEALKKKISHLLRSIGDDTSNHIEVEFPNLFKWFSPEVAIELSRIRRAIKQEPAKWCRKFFWVAFADTIRLSSNSRTSTFKLHIRPVEEIQNRSTSSMDTFANIIKSNFEKFSKIKDLLDQKGFLKKSLYTGTIEIKLGDTASHSKSPFSTKAQYDLLVTSPPYGDNTTTVPYGQYSYLPLQWIDISDIDGEVSPAFLSTAYEIDKRSLGGIKKNAIEETETLRKISKVFTQTLQKLSTEPKDRATRVAAFCRDLNRCIDPILNELKPNALMFWTIGNRRVGMESVPMDNILSDLLSARGAFEITRFHRSIPYKRMALRNSVASTMRRETILVVKKGNE